MLKMFKTL